MKPKKNLFLQHSIYLYSQTKHRIEYKIDLNDEKFITMKIDLCGFFLETQSFKTPRKVYRVDFTQLAFRLPFVIAYTIVEPMLWKESKIPNLDETKFKILHDSFHSFDKVTVPMTIIQRKNTNDTGKKPCLVYTYGGYGIPVLPLFKLFFLLFVELFNGVVGLY